LEASGPSPTPTPTPDPTPTPTPTPDPTPTPTPTPDPTPTPTPTPHPTPTPTPTPDPSLIIAEISKETQELAKTLPTLPNSEDILYSDTSNLLRLKKIREKRSDILKRCSAETIKELLEYKLIDESEINFKDIRRHVNI